MARILAALCMIAALVSGVAPGTASAQDGPICGRAGPEHWSEIRESLIGNWAIEHLTGYVQAGGMAFPFPRAPGADVFSIALFGDELVGTHPEAQEPLLLALADEPRWVVDAAGPGLPDVPFSPDDAALLYGCDQMEVPRILGTTEVVVEGVVMDFTYRMIAVSPDQVYGIMEVTGITGGYPFLARRIVWMNRTD